MQLELYLAETANLAADYKQLLDTAALDIQQSKPLSKLEQNGILHCLQVLAENAIGKARHLLKAAGQPIPISAYDAMQKLAQLQNWPATQVQQWNAIIGMRNRIVHEYMNINIDLVMQLVAQQKYLLITDFLMSDTL